MLHIVDLTSQNAVPHDQIEVNEDRREYHGNGQPLLLFRTKMKTGCAHGAKKDRKDERDDFDLDVFSIGSRQHKRKTDPQERGNDHGEDIVHRFCRNDRCCDLFYITSHRVPPSGSSYLGSGSPLCPDRAATGYQMRSHASSEGGHGSCAEVLFSENNPT